MGWEEVFGLLGWVASVLAAAFGVAAAGSGALYFYQTRWPFAARVTSQQEVNRLKRWLPRLKAIAVYFGLVSAVLWQIAVLLLMQAD